MQEPEGRPSEEEESSSSEDEREWRMELKKQQKEAKMNEEKPVANKPKFYELKSGENFRSMKSGKSASALKDKKYVCLLAESYKGEEGAVLGLDSSKKKRVTLLLEFRGIVSSGA